MDPYAFITDIAIASGFIFVGQILRKYIPFFQKFFVPSCMIAGFLGIIFGPHVLNVIPWSDAVGEYTWILIVLIFAIVGLQGFHFDKTKFKQECSRIGSFICYGQICACLQYCLPVAFAIVILMPAFDNVEFPAFGFLIAAGFYGGHGTAAAVGGNFERLGFENATDLAMTTATIGLCLAIFGGLLIIKWATSKGYTQYIRDFAFLPKEFRTGYIEPEKRKPLGIETMSSSAIDSFAWHFAITIVVSAVALWLEDYFNYYVPGFIFAFVLGLIIVTPLKNTWIVKSLDEDTFDRISGTATDYLVFFGIATVNIPIVVEYAVPLLILVIVGIAIVFFCMFWLGPAMNKDSWFERSLFVYGYCTGVYATAFSLLRIVDSENKSKTLTDLPFQAAVQVEALALGLAPAMLVAGLSAAWSYCGIFFGIAIVFLIIAIVFKWWYRSIPLSERGKVD